MSKKLATFGTATTWRLLGLTREAHFDVDIQRRVFLTALELELAKKLTTYSHKQGISAETLINLWLTEKMAKVAQSK